MKFFVRAILFLLLAAPAAVNAQTQKLGYIDYVKLMEQMPEVTKVQKEIDSIRASYAETYKEMQNRFQKYEAEVNSKEFQSYTEPRKRVIIDEAQRLQERMMTFEREVQEDMASEYKKRMTPIQDKVTNAVKAVAKENNYTFIFNGNPEILLYATETDNILPLVKKKLGMR